MITRRLSFVALSALTLSGCASVETAPAFASNDITVTTRGSGPDIVLIHGLAGHVAVWDETAAALDDRYRLHLVQIHGMGGVPGASFDSLVAAPVAREIARYIRETGVSRPALIGHSMGGTIAMMVAARHPGLAGRVMVIDMVPFMGGWLGQPDADVDDLRPVADRTRRQILEEDMFTQMVEGMATAEAHRQMLVRYSTASDRRIIARAMHEIIVTDMRPELARIDAPLTVVYAYEESVGMPAEQFDASMRASYANASDVTLVRVDDSRHYIHLDRPERFIAEVDAFMQQ